MHKGIKDIFNIFFLSVVSLMVFIPAIFTNTQREYRSEIDNTMLIEFPELDEIFPEKLNRYVEDRIGFRIQIITVYQYINNALFHYLAHPLYEYGKGEWVMTNNWDKAQTYHLDVPDDYVDAFCSYVDKMENIASEYGSEFMFVLVPNKETIYYDYISSGYNIDYENPTKSDRIIDRLNQMGIHNVYLRDVFLEMKDDILLYNVKNDAGHWNYNGAFYGIMEVYKYLINEMNVPVKCMQKEDFDITLENNEYLLESFLRIDEKYPMYSLKNEEYTSSGEEFWDDFEFIDPRNYHSHTVNEKMKASGKPSILIFGDSYILLRERLFANNFSEVMIIHRAESPKMKYYMEKLKPDIVILEATERVVGPNLDCNYDFLKQIYEYSE